MEARPPRQPRSFPEPASLEEAEAQMEKLHLDCREIEYQLGNNNGILPDGRKMTEPEFDQWRRRAKAALMFKREEYRFLKTWATKKRREDRSHDAVRLVRRAETILIDLTRETGERRPEVETLLRDIADFFVPL